MILLIFILYDKYNYFENFYDRNVILKVVKIINIWNKIDTIDTLLLEIYLLFFFNLESFKIDL